MMHHNNQRGLSLIELISVVAVMGTLASVIVPRVLDHYTSAKNSACHTQKREIEFQVSLWKRNNGSYPAANLGTIGADTSYFPDGLPTCPVDSTTYTIDTTTGRVNGHNH